MSKPRPERASEAQTTGAPAQVNTGLSAGVRRHLGHNLRTLYTDTLSAPADPRLEALVAQLSEPKR
jgi:hypothetical protein